ncbi:MAG TPA: AbrB/MazE/SpoVT family DNA-binding domain-containing protein [Thermoanaerobaculia bacterium]|jgi:bifunctional DNA-binding transcriptional regulator/antitoxin component of YhaV-PrlF toxin-antitoxin module|nr:AbrB/MazE/SpoVT family DNA-binding domain-containing protein [Thermoanaerobaculia bacterium]
MKRGAISTMDSAGRLVLPRDVRDQAKFEPGVPLRIVFRDGHVEIEAAPREVRVVRKGRMRVAVPLDEGAPLRSDVVRETTASIREPRR